jgi:hypothetical protein
MAKQRKRAKAVLKRQNGSNGRGREPVLGREALSIWTGGLELLESALGMLSDAILLPGKDDSLIARGNALEAGVSYSRLALDGMTMELIPPASRLIRDQLTIWREVAAIRLLTEETPASDRSRRLKKLLRNAIEQRGGGLDAELFALAQDGSASLRDLRGCGNDVTQSRGRNSTRETCAPAVRWGLIALGLLLHEARELGVMASEWRTRVATWEDSLGCWLQSPSSAD